jgi:hypothetical protein
MRGGSLAVTLMLSLATAACGDDTPTSPSSTSSTPTTSTITYTGTLGVGGARFYSFTNAAAGSVTALLASVAAADTRLPLSVPLQIGVGVPAGTDCATTVSQLVAPGLVSQVTVSLAAGTFCLRVADAGELMAPATFAVRFSHP